MFGRGLRILVVVVVAVMGLVPSISRGAQVTSRTSPTAYGERGTIGDYEVRVKSVDFDAAKALQEQESNVDSPSPGNVYVVADVEVTYKGASSSTPSSDLEFKAVGSKNRGYDRSNSDCGSIPNNLYDVGELFTDGAADFNACWQVSKGEARSLVMYVDTNDYPSTRAWFALSKAKSVPETPAATTAPATAPAETSFEITTVDLAFDPKTLAIPANTDVTITLTNKGVLQHDFTIDGADGKTIKSKLLNGGESDTVTVNLPAGTYQYYCSVPGHKQAGMVGILTVQ